MPRLESTTSGWIALVLLSVGLAAPARAQAPVVIQEPVTISEPAPRAPLGVELSMGVRTDQLRGAGSEPFVEEHALAELSLAARYRLAGGGLTLGFEWNYGANSSQARGAPSSLNLHRLSLSVRGQVAVRRRLVVFGRLAPSLVRVKTTLSDGITALDSPDYSNTLWSQTRWSPAVDGAVGVALRLVQVERPREPVFALWLLAEAGYSVTRSYQVALASGTSTAGRTEAPLKLGELTPGGGFLNFAGALTF